MSEAEQKMEAIVKSLLAAGPSEDERKKLEGILASLREGPPEADHRAKLDLIMQSLMNEQRADVHAFLVQSLDTILRGGDKPVDKGVDLVALLSMRTLDK